MAPEVKTTKNSKLPKLSKNYFEQIGRGGWPPISTWINTRWKYLADMMASILFLGRLAPSIGL
jgi:hypothetical protein